MFTKPNIQLQSATDITVELLNKMNITCLILDVDNTLCIKKGEIILDGVMNWLSDMHSAGIKLKIQSNAKPKRMGESTENCAIVGDQLLTDILGGNLAGCKTILVCPVELENSFGFKIKRGIERKLLKKYNLKCDF